MPTGNSGQEDKPDARQTQRSAALAAMRETQQQQHGRGMVPEPTDAPMAQVIYDWLNGANQHYDTAAAELTATWARRMLELERRRLSYFEQALGPLANKVP